MSTRNLFLAITAALSLTAIAGCDDGGSGGSGGAGGNTGGGGSGGATTTSTGGGGTGGDGGGNPVAPTLGAQIDRMGRPAINTALNHTFDGNPEQKDQAKDNWNENDDPTKWNQYVAEVQANLAILDGIDTICGNQLLADTTKTDPTRYATLATVLADDRIFVNSDGATCGIYLAVEADAVMLAPNNDCGGRALIYDVIDASYTVLVAGKIDQSIGDTIDAGAGAKGETFPYLAAPN